MLISVIIPCRNEVKNIAECVHAIYDSELEGDTIEVLLVDGLSDDGTIDAVTTLQKTYPSLRIITNELKVTPVAFNLGIKAAQGDYVQIIGARQVISKNYLKLAKQTLEDDPSIWCVGGGVENIYSNKESEIIGLAMASPFGVGAGNFRVSKKSEFTDTVGTPMYKKEVFDKIGLFNESLVRNQDDELNYRVTLNGGKIFLNNDILIKYYVRADLKKLFKQYQQYGYWKVYVNKMHKTVTSIRQLIPLFFVLGIFIGLLLSLFSKILLYAFLGGLLFYMVLALYFGIKVGGGFNRGGKVAKVFPVLHWGYGYGYLKGIIHFLILSKEPSGKSQVLTRG